MWLLLAFLSATLLGFYDVFKKKSLKDNAVLPVLFLNTLFSSLIFLPFILLSAFVPGVLEGTMFDVPVVGWEVHKFIIIKSFIVLSSWILGYFGILFIVLAAVAGAVSGLYDKYLMKQLPPMVVQSWYNVYQVFIMCPILALLWWPKRKSSTPFRWDWAIIFISIFLCAADFVYFYALSYEDSMISIVSMVRRGSVIVSFLFGAMMFREKNLKSKAIDLILVLIGMIFLYLGTK